MAVPDRLFADPQLAVLYDVFDADRSDLDAYCAIAAEFAATTILDIGCGTGSLAVRLAAAGYQVTGVDPATASLDVARTKPGADRVRWIAGEVAAVPVEPVTDLAVMTGNVAQVFLGDSEWDDTLTAIATRVRPGGHFVFEARDPAQRAWEGWTRNASERVRSADGAGRVRTWVDLTDVSLPFVSFQHHYVFEDRVFEDRDETLVSDSTLRFRTRDELIDSVNAAGFAVTDIRDAPDRPGLEFVFVCQRNAAATGTD